MIEQEQQSVSLPSIGRIVHFVSGGECNVVEGQHCAAIITAVDADGRVSLVEFGRHDFRFHQQVAYDDSGAKQTWHWPERA